MLTDTNATQEGYFRNSPCQATISTREPRATGSREWGSLTMAFDIGQFTGRRGAPVEYQRQLERLHLAHKHSGCIEDAVDGAIRNLRQKKHSFVIYGEPQSGKTEMMICLTAKLIDEGYPFILHLLNDSVDLLGQ